MAELPFGEEPNRMSQTAWHAKLVEGLRPNLPNELPGPLRNIIRQGWSTDPAQRPKAEDMLAVIDEYVIMQRSTVGSVEEV